MTDNIKDTAASRTRAEIDLEPVTLPDDGDENEGRVPPARTGQSQNAEKPVVPEGPDNPVHHSGRIPGDPLTK